MEDKKNEASAGQQMTSNSSYQISETNASAKNYVGDKATFANTKVMDIVVKLPTRRGLMEKVRVIQKGSATIILKTREQERLAMGSGEFDKAEFYHSTEQDVLDFNNTERLRGASSTVENISEYLFNAFRNLPNIQREYLYRSGAVAFAVASLFMESSIPGMLASFMCLVPDSDKLFS